MGTHHNNEAEQAVLGTMLMSKQALESGVSSLASRHFYQPRHSEIFEAIVRLEAERTPVDAISVAEDMQRAGTLHKSGGPLYLHELISLVSVTADVDHYIEIIRDNWDRRMLSDIGMQIRDMADSPKPSDELIEDARSLLDHPREGLSKAISMQDLMGEVIESIENGQIAGLNTPWPDLNAYIQGLQPGRVYVVAARPAVGKSLIGQALSIWFSEHHHTGVYFASLEMTRNELGRRVLAARTGISQQKIATNSLTDDEWGLISKAFAWTGRLRIDINEEPAQSVNAIRARARDLIRAGGLGLIVIDYLQLVEPFDRRAPRELQVSEISRALKRMAKELNVPIVALAQLNRSGSYRQDPTPVMTDIRESGAIEADADVIILLHRPDNDWRLQLIIEKNRGGATGVVELVLNGEVARIDAKASGY